MREGKKSYLSQSQAAAILLAPFLITYTLFLVYPFFRGVWISLYDWNLMEVAFNPDAKSYVGLRNYQRVMWGKNIGLGAAGGTVLADSGPCRAGRICCPVPDRADQPVQRGYAGHRLGAAADPAGLSSR